MGADRAKKFLKDGEVSNFAGSGVIDELPLNGTGLQKERLIGFVID